MIGYINSKAGDFMGLTQVFKDRRETAAQVNHVVDLLTHVTHESFIQTGFTLLAKLPEDKQKAALDKIEAAFPAKQRALHKVSPALRDYAETLKAASAGGAIAQIYAEDDPYFTKLRQQFMFDTMVAGRITDLRQDSAQPATQAFSVQGNNFLPLEPRQAQDEIAAMLSVGQAMPTSRRSLAFGRAAP